jgi:ParB/RepB/Spo0J family partition protein
MLDPIELLKKLDEVAKKYNILLRTYNIKDEILAVLWQIDEKMLPQIENEIKNITPNYKYNNMGYIVVKLGKMEYKVVELDKLEIPPIIQQLDRNPNPELENSIAVHGILIPLIVMRKPDAQEEKYLILDGVRRYKALKNLHINRAPVIVVYGPEYDLLAKYVLGTNTTRENISYEHIAKIIKYLKDELKVPAYTIAKKLLGISVNEYYYLYEPLTYLEESWFVDINDIRVLAALGRLIKTLGGKGVHYAIKVREKYIDYKIRHTRVFTERDVEEEVREIIDKEMRKLEAEKTAEEKIEEQKETKEEPTKEQKAEIIKEEQTKEESTKTVKEEPQQPETIKEKTQTEATKEEQPETKEKIETKPQAEEKKEEISPKEEIIEENVESIFYPALKINFSEEVNRTEPEILETLLDKGFDIKEETIPVQTVHPSFVIHHDNTKTAVFIYDKEVYRPSDIKTLKKITERGYNLLVVKYRTYDKEEIVKKILENIQNIKNKKISTVATAQ